MGALVTHIRRAASWWGRSRPPHVAVVVNPVSGRGTGSKVTGEVLLPLLRDVAGLRVTQLVTERPMHAADLVYGMRLAGCGGGGGDGGGGGGKEGREEEEENAVDLIAFCGGDGTLYEGLQVGAVHERAGRCASEKPYPSRALHWGLARCWSYEYAEAASV